MGNKTNFINKFTIVLVLIWTALMSLAAYIIIKKNYAYADVLAKNEAVVSVKKDLAYRTWVSSHGGVYVPITQKTPPNKYLSHIPNRDVNTTHSQQLTLMNPAYTLSQMMSDYSKNYGTKAHITSTNLLNPKNKADEWESISLEKLEAMSEPKAIYEKKYIDGKYYLRYLNPLITKESCLKCHAIQGYKVGDLRGGVSVAIPLDGYYKEAYEISRVNFLIIFCIYIIGLLVIVYARKKSKEILRTKIKDYEQNIYSLVNIIEKRDSYTAGHTQRVAKYSVAIAKEMGFSDVDIDNLYRACMLHDIGKISTPDSILLKPGILSKLEYEIIKQHVVVSYEILSQIDIYNDIAEIVRHHHENYDGSGYPQGLKCDDIPILSQIMSVADAFDAMTTNRIYKARKDIDDAFKELKELSSKQFNPKVVDAACKALKGIEIETQITQRPKTKLEQERFSYFYKDQVSGLYNAAYLELVLAYNHTDEFNLRCINIISLHNFGNYNKQNGWKQGDKLLREIARKLLMLSKSEFIFRIYGDYFIILNKEHFDFEHSLDILSELLYNTQVTINHSHLDIEKDAIKNINELEKML
jgi:putative nucleotidyltransferase with HDIG domain